MAAAGLVNAQTVTGVAKDDVGAALNGGTAALVRAKDTFVVKMDVISSSGAYTFSGISEGEYRVSVSHVGFNTALSPVFTFAGSDVTVPAITATKASADLTAITVSARKPMIEVRADKTVMNVEGTINAAGSDALELLRKSPGVTVDKDENLNMNGKNGVQVYVDGRPTPLTGADLAAYLKTMQASQIESIELITNPSAKYEAAGNAGIINIRMIKDKYIGTNANLSLGYNQAVHGRFNGNLHVNNRAQPHQIIDGHARA